MVKKADSTKISVCVSPQMSDAVAHWSAKHGMSKTEYCEDAINKALLREYGDYDYDDIFTNRLNEMVAINKSIVEKDAHLCSRIDEFMTTITRLIQGSNYLLE